jgi:diketogulonate reductase-like aldo/keto reductase
VLRLAALSSCAMAAPRLVAAAPTKVSATMNTRPIPRTQELLPTIGLGTWQAFDVDPARHAPQVEVVKQFLAAGGRVIDSSPMYGRAEATVGDVLTELDAAAAPFFATKVWTRGKREGAAQMEQSRKRMHAARIDLMQIHNLLDWQTHLPVLREMKQAGAIRYLGVTHYAHAEFPQIERMMRTEALDFIQIPYNLSDRAVEARILPAAADTGTGVLVMRPFEEGALFKRVRGKPLPGWAAELDCTSWAQVFLKFIIGHPAVTCPIPATADPAHLADNVKAGIGRLPDAAQRRAMIAAVGA